MSPCECLYCRISHATKNLPPDMPPTEVAYIVLCSLRCARCGVWMEFEGLIEMRVCDDCEEKMAMGRA